MVPDPEGFVYPQINGLACTDCGRCRNACPWLNPSPSSALPTHRREKPKSAAQPPVFAAWNLNHEIRNQSSSGGVFSAIAEVILKQGGLVIGAAFNNGLNVSHIMIDNSADLVRLRGSKYVQSEISIFLYQRIQEELTKNRPLLFSGTPCQVAALYRFLGRHYPTLYTCDLVCHGVPSPKWLSRYLCQETKKVSQLVFREKCTGWKGFCLKLVFPDGSTRLDGIFNNPYMCSFLRDYSLRPACYKCKFATLPRVGDLTIADFWGVGQKYPEYDRDDKGTSLVLVNTPQGQIWLDACRSTLFLGQADLATAIAGNPMLAHPSRRPPERKYFYQDVAALSLSQLCRKYHLSSGTTFWRRSWGFAKRRLFRLIIR